MKRHIAHALAASLFLLPFACTQGEPASTAAKAASDRARAVDQLQADTNVLAELTKGPDIPAAQRARARCVVVVPAMVSGGLLVGGSGGRGVVSCRTGAEWSGPAFVKMGGPSVGLQAGVKSADLMMLVETAGAASKLFRGDLELGANASVAAGPVGAGSHAATSTQASAEILTYARSRGLFAGVDVSGMFVKTDQRLNVALYGPSADANAILQGLTAAPPESAAFLAQLKTAFPPRAGAPAISLR